jgi:RNAse (barnase) inhibitor barstar
MGLPSNIIFLKPTDRYTDQSEFIANIDSVTNDDELFSKLSEALKFPDYFGQNWNAVYDLLRDFYWIPNTGIVLIHNEMPKLSNDELKIYLEVLADSMNDWKEGEQHYFKVIFPEDARLVVKGLLGDF